MNAEQEKWLARAEEEAAMANAQVLEDFGRVLRKDEELDFLTGEQRLAIVQLREAASRAHQLLNHSERRET